MNERIRRGERVRLLCRSGVLCAVLCVMAVITVPTGGVPLTLGVLGVFLCGMLLPPAYAAGTAFAYLLLGALGLPVFSGMRGGVQMLFGMTGGFLMAYPVMTWMIAMLCTKTAAHTSGGRLLRDLTAAVLSLAVCYLIGAAWFTVYAGCSIGHALTAAVVPFIGADLLKAAAAALISGRIRSR